MKNRHLKRLIEDAIERCSGVKMHSAKSYLIRALKEVSEVEKREEKKREQPSQQWKFDVSTGKLRNMTRDQASNALKNIEKMIEDETLRKNGADEEGELFTG